MSRHLDLGCAGVPRNPYNRDDLYGVDLVVGQASDHFKAANLAIHPIPFESNYFDSVSAYDFLEHIPRVLACTQAPGTRAPFIELMNEIWRVLTPGGRFYASTPVYPHPAVFQDPTHVNFLTTMTHMYFTRPALMGRMYGFTGDFSVLRVQRHRPDQSILAPIPTSLWQRARQRLREKRGRCTHVVWEFEAQK